MAYDPAANESVLFGGYGNVLSGETWVYGATGWTDLTPRLAASPVPSIGAAMAYDPHDQAVILFGGGFDTYGGPYYGYTWSFNGSSWTNETKSVGPGPPPRLQSQLAYDPNCDCLILFGGLQMTGSGGFTALRDTWEFHNDNWTKLATGGTGTPPGTYNAVLAYDPTGSQLLLFGGGLASPWMFKSNNWTQAPAGSFPSQLQYQSTAASSPGNGSLIAFGGYGCPGKPACSFDWRYSNGSWTSITPTEGIIPEAQQYPILVWDSTTDDFLLVESQQFSSTVLTYALGGPLRADLNVSPSTAKPGQPISIAVGGEGGVGSYNLSLTGLPPNCTYAPPAFSCEIGSSGVYQLQLIVTDASGNQSNSAQPVVVCCSLGLSISATPGYGEVGVNLSLSVGIVGGDPPYTAVWAGLPSGCLGSQNVSLSCTPDLPGEYLVRTTVRDHWNSTATIAKDLNVTSRPLLVAHASPDSGPAPLLINLSATMFGGAPPERIVWSLQDGKLVDGNSTSETITAPGTYSIQAVGTDGLGIRSSSMINITVLSPVVSITPLSVSIRDSGSIGPAPFTWLAIGNVGGGVPPYSYVWLFGDGGTSTGSDVSHIYRAAANYTPILVVTDSTGISRSNSSFVEVQVNSTLGPPPSTSGTTSTIAPWIPVAAVLGAATGIAAIALAVWTRTRRGPPNRPGP